MVYSVTMIDSRLNPVIDDMVRNHVNPDDFAGWEDKPEMALLRKLAIMARNGERFENRSKEE